MSCQSARIARTCGRTTIRRDQHPSRPSTRLRRRLHGLPGQFPTRSAAIASVCPQSVAATFPRRQLGRLFGQFGPLPADGTRRFRQTFFNMSADPTLTALPYWQSPREYIQAGRPMSEPEPQLQRHGRTPTTGDRAGELLAGDLPRPPRRMAPAGGAVSVNIAFSVTQAANGVQTAVLSHGASLSLPREPPRGLVIDLSPGVRQWCFSRRATRDPGGAAKLTFDAKITDARDLNGSLLIDQLSPTSTATWCPTRQVHGRHIGCTDGRRCAGAPSNSSPARSRPTSQRDGGELQRQPDTARRPVATLTLS